MAGRRGLAVALNLNGQCVTRALSCSTPNVCVWVYVSRHYGMQDHRRAGRQAGKRALITQHTSHMHAGC